jgi:hypothetical protein
MERISSITAGIGTSVIRNNCRITLIAFMLLAFFLAGCSALKEFSKPDERGKKTLRIEVLAPAAT